MTDLGDRLAAIWDRQAADGFLLSPPGSIETRVAPDPEAGIEYRFVWLPHRELRHDIAGLERRGILDPDRDAAALVRDPRDGGRHCFLCPANIRLAHPREELAEFELAGRCFAAAVNFAWAAPHHFTVMTRDHTDQRYGEQTLPEMLELQERSGFRVTFHGAGVGATIPWHLHYQVTSQRFPAEDLAEPDTYPTPALGFSSPAAAHGAAAGWIARDPDYHDVNLLVAPGAEGPRILLFPRDRRRSNADNKGLIGSFETAGYFVYSAPDKREVFATADAVTARAALEQVRPHRL